MVELMQDDTNLSRRTQNISKETTESAEMTDSNKKLTEDLKQDNESDDVQQSLLGRISGSVLNTTKYAAGTAYGGVTWVAGGVLSTTGSAIGATYNTVSSYSPITIFRKESKSKSD